MPFNSLGLSAPLRRAVAAAGYAEPTPIQAKIIPTVLAGKDAIGAAQTGTGKTAAFALPILERLITVPRSFEFRTPRKARPMERSQRRAGLLRNAAPAPEAFSGTRVLVLAPTRELAAQVETSFRDLGRFTDVRTLAIYGGVGFQLQLDTLAVGVDVIVATPGRLLDLMDRRAVSLSNVEVLVLDEADRMLDMGFIPDLRRIVRTLPTRRQTLLFSATVPPEIDELAQEVLIDPVTVAVGKRSAPVAGVTQLVYPVAHTQKLDLLAHVLAHQTDLDSVLIFTRTKHGADKLAGKLAREGYVTGRLHSNRTQSQRESALSAFRAGRLQVLVATDIAARGLDIENISHVINYDVPTHPEDYVHRIGRTARAAAVGTAITLMTSDEEKYLRLIERFISGTVPRVRVEGFPYHEAPSFDSAPSQRLRSASANGHPAARRQRYSRRGRRPWAN